MVLCGTAGVLFVNGKVVAPWQLCPTTGSSYEASVGGTIVVR